MTQPVKQRGNVQRGSHDAHHFVVLGIHRHCYVNAYDTGALVKLRRGNEDRSLAVIVGGLPPAFVRLVVVGGAVAGRHQAAVAIGHEDLREVDDDDLDRRQIGGQWAGQPLPNQRIVVAGDHPLFVQLGQLGQDGLRSAAVGIVLGRNPGLHLRVLSKRLQAGHLVSEDGADVVSCRTSQTYQAFTHLRGERSAGAADVEQRDDAHREEGHHQEDENQLDPQRKVGKPHQRALRLVGFPVGWLGTSCHRDSPCSSVLDWAGWVHPVVRINCH